MGETVNLIGPFLQGFAALLQVIEVVINALDFPETMI